MFLFEWPSNNNSNARQLLHWMDPGASDGGLAANEALKRVFPLVSLRNFGKVLMKTSLRQVLAGCH